MAQDAFLSRLWEPLHHYFVDSVNDSLITLVRFSLTCSEAQRVAFESLRKLDFSYLHWHSLKTPRIVNRGDTAFNVISRAVWQENDAVRNWGLARVKTFISNSDKLKNLRSLDLSGTWIDSTFSSSRFVSEKLASLQLEHLNIQNCNWISDPDLHRLLNGTPLSASLRSLHIGNQENLSDTYQLIADNCVNLEELDWYNRARPKPSLPLEAELQLIKRVATGCKSLKKLGICVFQVPASSLLPLFEHRLSQVTLYGSEKWLDAYPSFVRAAADQGIELQRIYWRFTARTSLSRYFPVVGNIIAHTLLNLPHVPFDRIEESLKKLKNSYPELPELSSIDCDISVPRGITLSLIAVTGCYDSDILEWIKTYAAAPHVHYCAGLNYLSAGALMFTRSDLATTSLIDHTPSSLKRALYHLGSLGQTILMISPGILRGRHLLEYLRLSAHLKEDINQQDMFGFTVLHYAALLKLSLKDWKALLYAGADPLVRSLAGSKSTPLELLLRYQPNSSAVREALKRIDLDEYIVNNPEFGLLAVIVSDDVKKLDRYYLNPLSGKSNAQDAELALQALLRANAVYPLLIAACFRGSRVLAKALSSTAVMDHLDLNEETSVAYKKARGTALHFAAAQGLPDCCKLLIAAGADVNHTAPKYGKQTPLLSACSTVGGSNCVLLLLEHMKDNHISLNYAQEPQKYTALHWAATWPASCSEVFQKLVVAPGIQPFAQDRYGRSPRDWAARHPFKRDHPPSPQFDNFWTVM